MTIFWSLEYSSPQDFHQSIEVFKLIELIVNGQPKYFAHFLKSSI